MSHYKLTERELRPGCREIEVEGELDLAVADRLREAIERSADCEHLLIGLSRCEFIDSTGIAVIVKAHAEMTRRGRRVAVFGACDQVARVLHVTGLDRDGFMFETAAEALAAT